MCSVLRYPQPSSSLKTFSNNPLHHLPLSWPLLALGESQRLVAQEKNVVDNMQKHDNNRLPLYAVSMDAVTTSIKDNEITKTARKCRMLATVSTIKWETWLANKCSDKDVLVENSGLRNSRFKICKYSMFITMCQLTSSSYVHPKWNGSNPLDVESQNTIQRQINERRLENTSPIRSKDK